MSRRKKKIIAITCRLDFGDDCLYCKQNEEIYRLWQPNSLLNLPTIEIANENTLKIVFSFFFFLPSLVETFNET